MATEKIAFTPEQNGYQVQYGNPLVSTRLDGGTSRVRLDMLNAADTVNVSWLLTEAELATLMTFFNTTLVNGSLPFLIDLLISDSVLREHTARLVPGTMRLNNVSGLGRMVSATLEVDPNATPLGPVLGAALYVPPATSKYFLWDLGDMAVNVATSSSDNVGPFYPQTSDTDWSLGSQGSSGDSTEWAFSSGAFEWTQTGDTGLKCITGTKTGFRPLYNNSNVATLLPRMWPDGNFWVCEFAVVNFQQGGPSNNEEGILFNSPFASNTKNMRFGITATDSLKLTMTGTAGATDSANSQGTYNLTTPFTGHIAAVLHTDTSTVYFFVNGVEVYSEVITVPAGLSSTVFDTRPHLAINTGGTTEEPPLNTTYRYWNMYQIITGDIPTDWANDILLNNHTFLQNLLGY